ELDLALEALALARGRLRSGEQDLERDRAPRRLLHRAVDDPLAAAPDLRLDAVAGDALLRARRGVAVRARGAQLAEQGELARALLDAIAAARAGREMVPIRDLAAGRRLDRFVAPAGGHRARF